MEKKAEKIGVKTAFFVEEVLRRNHYIHRVEEFLSPFDRAPVFTFAHRPGEVKGSMEQRPIFSSYLSHFAKGDLGKLETKAYLLPHVAKTFHVDCHTRLVVSLSKGFAHGISKPHSATHLCHLYDWNLPSRGFLNRVLRRGMQQWMIDSLQSIDVLWVSREEVARKVEPYFSGSVTIVKAERSRWKKALEDFVAQRKWVTGNG